MYRRPQRNRQLFESSYFQLCSTEIRNARGFQPRGGGARCAAISQVFAHMNVAPAQEAAAAKNMVLTSWFGVKSSLSDSWMTPHKQHVFCGVRGHRRDYPLGGIIFPTLQKRLCEQISHHHQISTTPFKRILFTSVKVKLAK